MEAKRVRELLSRYGLDWDNPHTYNNVMPAWMHIWYTSATDEECWDKLEELLENPEFVERCKDPTEDN